MDVKMVEIAVGILAKEPTDPIKPVREWAVDVLSEYSDVSLRLLLGLLCLKTLSRSTLYL